MGKMHEETCAITLNCETIDVAVFDPKFIIFKFYQLKLTYYIALAITKYIKVH